MKYNAWPKNKQEWRQVHAHTNVRTPRPTSRAARRLKCSDIDKVIMNRSAASDAVSLCSDKTGQHEYLTGLSWLHNSGYSAVHEQTQWMDSWFHYNKKTHSSCTFSPVTGSINKASVKICKDTELASKWPQSRTTVQKGKIRFVMKACIQTDKDTHTPTSGDH